MKRFWQIEIITAVIMIVTNLAGPALADISWSGDVDPSDPSTWNSDTNGYIGINNLGTMDITGGSDVKVFNGYIGYSSGSMGSVTVDGAGSTWTSSYTLRVGLRGYGTLNIKGGGAVTNHYGVKIGSSSYSTGIVTVDGAGSKWTNSDDLTVGSEGNGTMNIINGGAVTNHYGYIGEEYESTSEVTVDGTGSTWTNIYGLTVGGDGDGTLNITNGGVVRNNKGHLGFWSGSTGEVSVDGSDSTWTNGSSLDVGHFGNGTLNITNGGLVSVAETLTIDYNGGDDSFINMATGGMLALFGDGDDSLVDFMELIDGTDAIRYLDDSGLDWVDITGATYGIDYTLQHLTNGDLAGYTILTVTAVPEPCTLIMLSLGGLVLRRRKA